MAEYTSAWEHWNAVDNGTSSNQNETALKQTTSTAEPVAQHMTESAQTAESLVPVPVELDYSLLATPAELLDAFGRWGMKPSWFDDLNSRQWLQDARRKKGQGQRRQVIAPLFCPFAVMNGLVEKVRKANRLQPDTAWRTLAHKFPKVYAEFEEYDPRDLTGC